MKSIQSLSLYKYFMDYTGNVNLSWFKRYQNGWQGYILNTGKFLQ